MKPTLALLPLLVAACASVPPEGNGSEGDGSTTSCSPAPLQSLVGQPATSELGAEAMRLSGARQLRWIRPGDAVTMDYREDRLNVRLDAENRVEEFNCG